MKTGRDSPVPPSPNVSKTRRFLGVAVITGVTIVATRFVEAIFCPQMDDRSVLHLAIYRSFYMLLYFLYEKYFCA